MCVCVCVCVCVCEFKRINGRLVLEKKKKKKKKKNNLKNIKGAVYQASERASRLRKM